MFEEQTLEELDDYQDFETEWINSIGIDPDEYVRIHEAQTEVHYSADLTEATYNIPFEVLDENLHLCDEIMSNFTPWKTFHNLFRSHIREVDMTQLVKSGYWNGPATITSTRGSFMGDGMSFIHLTLLLSGIVRMVCDKLDIERPLGQSVGDDLFLLNTRIKTCALFCYYAEKLGCKFSKLNSVSEDSGTFCEQYFVNVSDIETYTELKQFNNSIFGDLAFLDTIKGSTMSGNSKIKTDGKSPLIGHGQLLNKQIEWNPWQGVEEKAKTFLWASNFMEARKLASAMCSLPPALGGINIALGTILNYHDDRFHSKMLPWYETILDLELTEFLKYYLLLTGIYRANPKGFTWENKWDSISSIVENSTLHDFKNLDDAVPEELKGQRAIKKLNYINDELNMISFRHLTDELARRDAFHKMWNGIETKSFMTLKISNVRQRANHAWAIIKSNLEPTDPKNFKSVSIKDLNSRYQERSWGLYVSKEDPSITDVFCGTPSMFMDVEEFDNTVYSCDSDSSESNY
jgi:hypothetical protein